ncbi:hypothetical protein CC86DRAFT_384788 [Ophiobolus disseminans]|uniref:Uncharacterized protein n=1 Tax=Ophiobolus disseminans TaxID=1469910 RepID=A0A6A6ZS45_9PLEO|nr:hypothetical protein CC86DRAFT_384788 [Ophiobolus disseminans]
MCHWVLRMWKCGDSNFTKHLSCSVDRAANDPYNLLNPVHPSIKPCKQERTIPARQLTTGTCRSAKGPESPTPPKAGTGNAVNGPIQKRKRESWPSTAAVIARSPTPPRPTSRTIDDCNLVLRSATPKVEHARNARTGEVISGLSLAEVGKVSRFGETLGTFGRCSVFEVVLQTNEKTACPAYARSPRRASLPARMCTLPLYLVMTLTSYPQFQMLEAASAQFSCDESRRQSQFPAFHDVNVTKTCYLIRLNADRVRGRRRRLVEKDVFENTRS